MAEVKVTKKERYAILKTIVERAEDVPNKDEMLAFIDHEVELLNKKHSKTEPSKKDLENDALKNELVDMLDGVDKPVTITELIAIYNLSERGLSNQKISRMLNEMVGTRVAKTVDKKKSYFSALEVE